MDMSPAYRKGQREHLPHARAVLALDADRSIDRKAPGAPPRAHVRHGGGIQELVPGEPPQNAQLYRTRQGFRVSDLESGGFVEAHPVLDVAGDHTVEGQHVVVVVGT